MTTAIGSTGSTGTISSAGIGSGLDVNGIVTQLMAIEQRPLTLLTNAASAIQSKISAFGALQSAQSSFRDAAQALSTESTWSTTTGASSDAGTVGVSTSSTAAAGTYAITVQSLAAAQSVATATFNSSAAAVGAGTLHIDLGSWNVGQTSFTAQAGSTGLDITVAPTDTLASVRDKINTAAAGVSATIVTDASGARLVLSSSKTGTANGFRITAADSDGNNTDPNGLSALAFDPAGGTTGAVRTQAAANATATINGLSVSSASNVLTDVVQGLSLNLVKLTASPIQITVAQDTASSRTAITGFVTAYNNLAKLLSSDIKYDSSTKAAGVLQADSTAVSLQRQLRNMLGASSASSSVFATLSQAGLELQADGTLKINDTKLTAAMGNMPEVKKLFASNDVAGKGANDGFALRLRKFGDAVLGTDGMLTTRTAGLNTSLTANTKNQDAMSTRLAATEARMRAQYSALDTKMATLNALNTYMTQQIANWNKSTA